MTGYANVKKTNKPQENDNCFPKVVCQFIIPPALLKSAPERENGIEEGGGEWRDGKGEEHGNEMDETAVCLYEYITMNSTFMYNYNGPI